MLANKNTIKKITKSLKSGSDDYRVNGKTCDGYRWPEGNHFYVVDDLVNQETYHIPVDDVNNNLYNSKVEVLTDV